MIELVQLLKYKKVQYTYTYIINLEVGRMGVSHSQHRQYLEQGKRIHGYQKASSRRGHSASVTARTRMISANNNNKINPNQQRKTERKKVVYYPSDYNQTPRKNPSENTVKNQILHPFGLTRTRSQSLLPLNLKDKRIYQSDNNYQHKVYQQERTENHFQHIPENTSIIVSASKNEDAPEIEQQKNSNELNNRFTQKQVSKQSRKFNSSPMMSSRVRGIQQSNKAKKLTKPSQQYYPQPEHNQNYVIRISKQNGRQKVQNQYGTYNVKSLADVYRETNIKAYQTPYRGPYGNEHGCIQ